MKRPPQLSVTFVRSVTRPGRYGDGRGGFGLSLLVKPTASGRLSKSWAQRIRINGKVTNLGLGGYPIVTLKEARDRAIDNRRKVEAGKDPRTPPTPTVELAAEAVRETLVDSWRGQRSEGEWRASLERYVFPRIGQMPVDKFTTADVAAILTPIWSTKTATARKLRSRIGMIAKWAISMGYRDDDPSGPQLDAALPRAAKKAEHYRAAHHSDVAKVLAKVQDSDEHPTVKLAIELIAHTACRSGEVRGMQWSEIDLAERVWTVPASRSKVAKPHRVPLSDQAVELIEQARQHSDGSGLVLPSAKGNVIADALLSRLLKRLDTGTTPHGLRSSFRSWCADEAIDREVAEASLGHVNPNRGESAYQRSDMLERRRETTQAWSDYIAE